MRNTPGTTHECSSKIFLQTDEVSDVIDTYPHMEPNVEARLEQPENSPTIPAVPNTTCVITRSLTAMTTIYIRLSAEQYVPRNAHVDVAGNSRNALRGTYVAAQLFRILSSGYSLVINSPATQS